MSRTFILFFLSFFSIIQNLYAAQYSIVDLGPGAAYGINNTSQVVGTFGLYADGVITSIGGTGNAINNNGQIVGNSSSGAFFWDNGNVINLGNNYSYADGINNVGQVVGRDGSNAWVWDSINGKQLLGNGMTAASGINDFGQIAGMVRNSSNLLVPAVWQNNVMSELGTFGGLINEFSAVNGSGSDINNNGEVVGFTRNTANDNYSAFLWDEVSGLQNIAGFDSYANAINSQGQVVGFMRVGFSGLDYYHAFIWDSQEGLFDLNNTLTVNPGWTRTIAFDINDKGQIVGFGKLNGSEHAFLASPMAAPVPEPASILLFGLGGAGLLLRRIKYKNVE